MRKIAVFFDAPGEDDYPFNHELYRTVYRQLAQTLDRNGGALFVVRGQQTYLGKNTFTHAWKFSDGTFSLVNGPLSFDLIWNRGGFAGGSACRMINDPALAAITTDKWRCYQLMPDLHPRTALVHSPKELEVVIATMHADRIVAKPVDGWGGNGVFIGSREHILQYVSSFPYIIQEFIDTCRGIPGIVSEPYDLRIISIQGEVNLCYIRTAPPGEFTANVSRGGKEIEVPPSAIPSGAMELFRNVDRHFQMFPDRIYCVDMALHVDGRWKIIELNSQPGFSPMETGASYPPFYHRLSEFLVTTTSKALL